MASECADLINALFYLTDEEQFISNVETLRLHFATANFKKGKNLLMVQLNK